MSPLKIITTSDGSHSLYNEELRETYHSTHGAVTESQYVFIEKGLNYLKASGVTDFRILEVGFGTGLNVLLVWDFARKNRDINIHLQTLEPYPLEPEIYKNLNYIDALETSLNNQNFLQLHLGGWSESIDFEENFSFKKHKAQLQEFRSETTFNLVFYDAFAPSKQSEMWDVSTLSCIYNVMSPSSVLTTYCAQGQFKRNLSELGLEVETLQGPPGKKEMVRGEKLNLSKL